MRFLIAISAALLFAQSPVPTPEPISEPEFADVFFGVTDGKLVPLERKSAVARAKVSGFIALSVKGVMDFDGSFSPVRLHGGELRFAVKPPSASVETDPAELYHLRKLSVGKNRRELLVSTVKATPFGASGRRGAGDESLATLTFLHYGQSSYIATAVLSPGEYAIGKAAGHTVFCFGVD